MTLKLSEDNLEWRSVDDEVLALDVRSSEYLMINGSGQGLWERLARGTSRSELVRALVEQFGISEQRAAADVEEFLAQLRDRGLLAE